MSSVAVDVRYPIGPVSIVASYDPASRAAAIARIAALPTRLHEAVRGLSATQLDTRYRDGGWTLRQVVHHLADSHLNAYVRFKLVATEIDPPLKVWDENAWAALPDARGPIGGSLLLVTSLHERWTQFLRELPAAAFARTGMHAQRGPLTLDALLSIYSWHGDHHAAHITELRRRMGW
jgi:uncharacterized damage-inducible protein DinB